MANDSEDEDQDYKSVKILKNKNSEHETKLLVEDETSIIHILSNHKLNINRLYTKDESYKKRLNAVLVDYEKER